MPAGSRYSTAQLNLSGASYESRTMPVSSQRSFNMYPDVTQDGIAPVVMSSWPGLSLRNITFNTPEIIGCYVFEGVFYAVSGVTLRKYSNDLSSYTEIGDITKASFARARFSDNGEVMVIVAGADAWQYDGATLSKITSVDFKPTEVQFLNERFFMNGDDGGYSVSDVLSTNFDAANTFYARSTPSLGKTLHIFNQVIYLADSDSIEPWNDVSVGAPPVARINQGIIEKVGCNSIYGISSSDRYMYFIGSDSHAYRVNGFSVEEITNPVIANHFRSLDEGRCTVDFIDVNGHKFIVYYFTADAECWVFSESSGQWFEVGNEPDSDGNLREYQFVSPVFYRGNWICGDILTGSIFQVDTDYALNGTQSMVRERIISTLSGEDVGQPGVMLEMSKLRISMQTGNSNPFFSKQPPEMMIVPSFDGGNTFSRPILLDIGRTGQFTLPVEVHLMQQFRRAVFKLRVTDRVGEFSSYSLGAISIFSASIDYRVVPY